MKVDEVMTTTVVTVSPETSFPEVVDTLLTHGISGVPVVDDRAQLVGIVTEADLVSKAAYGGRRRRLLELLADLVAGGETRWAVKGKGRTAAHLMTTKVETAAPDDDVRAAARTLLAHHLKRLPVVADGRLVGVVSRTDLLRVLHRGDADLERDLLMLLADPSRTPAGVAVEGRVVDGVVTLRGSVRFPTDRLALTAAVWRLPGVVDVRDETAAREPEPTIVPS